jgi:formylglycine-generating enzyme required for sulfatase activity
MKKIFFVSSVVVCLSFTLTSHKPTFKKKFKGPDNFVFIPSGKSQIKGESYSFNAFWMMDHEVTNFEYYSFLKQLLLDGRAEDFKVATLDTTQWSEIGGFYKPMQEFYSTHPSYANYPVVNVSKEGAELFCNYLTNHYQSIYGKVISKFRLPTKHEWIYAAKGGNSKNIYAWNGNYLRNASGDILANFCMFGDENITATKNGFEIVKDSTNVDLAFDDGAYIIATTKSYWPNDFGLYNMSGNVSELVSDENVMMGGDWHTPGHDIRIESTQEYKGASPYSGFRVVLSHLEID